MNRAIPLILMGCGPTLLDTAMEDLPTYEELPDLITCDISMEGSGEVVGDLDCTGGICKVAEGLAWLGSDLGEPYECPPRAVDISDFSIDQFEVTRSQYAACEDAGACLEVPEHHNLHHCLKH